MAHLEMELLHSLDNLILAIEESNITICSEPSSNSTPLLFPKLHN